MIEFIVDLNNLCRKRKLPVDNLVVASIDPAGVVKIAFTAYRLDVLKKLWQPFEPFHLFVAPDLRFVIR